MLEMGTQQAASPLPGWGLVSGGVGCSGAAQWVRLAGGQWCRSPLALLACHPGVSDPTGVHRGSSSYKVTADTEFVNLNHRSSAKTPHPALKSSPHEALGPALPTGRPAPALTRRGALPSLLGVGEGPGAIP